MNIYDFFPSKYVKAGDLNGRDVTVKVKGLEVETVGAPPNESEKPVLYFHGAQKGLILNKTNATTMASLYGPETDNWPGKFITLYATKVRAFGAMHDVIRIRPSVVENIQERGNDIDDAEDTVDPEDAAELPDGA